MALDAWVLQVVLACCVTLAIQGMRARGMLRMPQFSIPFLASFEIRRRPPAVVVPPRSVSKPPPPHVTLSAAKATDLFLEHLATEWCERFLAASQVDEGWIAFAKSRGIYLIGCNLIRGEMAERGLCLGYRRLTAPELLHIKHALGGKDRATVYKRLTEDEIRAARERGSQLVDTASPEDDRLLVGHETTPRRRSQGDRQSNGKTRIKKRILTPRQEVSRTFEPLQEAA